jgi:hypothetical protein
VLRQRLPNSSKVPVAEDAKASFDKSLFDCVPFDVLDREETNERLRHRQTNRLHAVSSDCSVNGYIEGRANIAIWT